MSNPDKSRKRSDQHRHHHRDRHRDLSSSGSEPNERHRDEVRRKVASKRLRENYETSENNEFPIIVKQEILSDDESRRPSKDQPNRDCQQQRRTDSSGSHRRSHHHQSESRERRHRDDRSRQRLIKSEPTSDSEERRSNDRRRRENRSDQPEQWGREPVEAASKPEPNVKKKEEPNFELSGKLTEDTNTFRGVVIKYNEPPEAMKPKRRWRLYVLKGDDVLPVYHIHRQSGYLIGRERRIADLPVDHPSCSKQHAVLQFRAVPYERVDGTQGRRVRPYIIDLGSTNGTYVNNERIEAKRYVELFEKDVLKFGFSSRDFVLMTDKTDIVDLDDQ